MSSTQLGKVIRKLRIDAEVTQLGMARALGVTNSYLSAVENGIKDPSAEFIDNIVNFFESLGFDAGVDIRKAALTSASKITISLQDKSPEFIEALFQVLEMKS